MGGTDATGTPARPYNTSRGAGPALHVDEVQCAWRHQAAACATVDDSQLQAELEKTGNAGKDSENAFEKAFEKAFETDSETDSKLLG